MQPSTTWFLFLAILGLMGWLAGVQLGRGSTRQVRLTLIVGILLMLAWAWLQHRPDLSVHIFPVRWLTHMEGTAAVPLFMLLLGMAWSRSRLPRQRRLALLGMAVGVVFFLQGGLWMVQTTPQLTQAHLNQGPLVFQSQDFTCVPAACATALNRMDVPTTEWQMAQLTRTRPGTGSTLIRAVDGLQQRLSGTGISVHVLTPTYDQLMVQPMPALTLLRTSAERYLHMVTLLEVNRLGVYVADPMYGTYFLERPEFERVYAGQAIVFAQRRL
jgi:predicted double-glycine peptidase